jgi:hypothetical protein
VKCRNSNLENRLVDVDVDKYLGDLDEDEATRRRYRLKMQHNGDGLAKPKCGLDVELRAS